LEENFKIYLFILKKLKTLLQSPQCAVTAAGAASDFFGAKNRQKATTATKIWRK
jgi:hypothetical protein